MTNKEKYAIMQTTIWLETLTNLLISKNIITEKEFTSLFDKSKNKEEYQLDKLEILSNIENICQKENLSEEDEKYLKETGIKVDTQENINLLINTLKAQNQFKNIFGLI